MTILYQHYGSPESVILSLVPSYLGLRVNFREALYEDDELNDVDNYTIYPYEAAAVSFEIISVTPEPGGFPTYIDLECNDLTGGKGYRLIIAGGVIQDAQQTKYFTGGLRKEYTSVSVVPVIQTMRSTSLYEMQVVFSKPMDVNVDLLDESNWSFDKGLEVLSVTSLAPGVVALKTTKQTPSELYTLTVS